MCSTPLLKLFHYKSFVERKHIQVLPTNPNKKLLKNDYKDACKMWIIAANDFIRQFYIACVSEDTDRLDQLIVSPFFESTYVFRDIYPYTRYLDYGERSPSCFCALSYTMKTNTITYFLNHQYPLTQGFLVDMCSQPPPTKNLGPYRKMFKQVTEIHGDMLCNQHLYRTTFNNTNTEAFKIILDVPHIRDRNNNILRTPLLTYFACYDYRVNNKITKLLLKSGKTNVFHNACFAYRSTHMKKMKKMIYKTMLRQMMLINRVINALSSNVIVDHDFVTYFRNNIFSIFMDDS